MMAHLRNRTASPAVVYFACSRLAVVIAVITAYHVTKPLESVVKPTRAPAGVQGFTMGHVQRRTPDRTYAEHAANIAAQSARIADLHNEEQELLCEALVNASCDNMASERCVETVHQCHGLGTLHDVIAEERMAVEAVFALGFLELEAICDRIITRDGQLAFEQAGWRATYRTTLLEHLDGLSDLLRRRNEVLGPLRTAVAEVGGEAMLEQLEVPRRHDAARAAADSILESAEAIHLGERNDRPPAPDAHSTYDPRIPPCGGDVQCWKI